MAWIKIGCYYLISKGWIKLDHVYVYTVMLESTRTYNNNSCYVNNSSTVRIRLFHVSNVIMEIISEEIWHFKTLDFEFRDI